MKNVVIIPTYNEKENIEVIIPLIYKLYPEIYVCVVDDNSPDGTAGSVNLLKKQYVNLSLILRKGKEGLAKAYIHAFKEVLKDNDVETIIMMDADLSHDPKHIGEMIELRKKYDVIVGSRYIKGGRTEGWEFYRRLLSRLGNIYAKLITQMPVNECTGGFNAINANILRKINLDEINMSGYAFIMYFKYVLYKNGAKFFEIPICFKNRVEGVSKLSNMIIREGILAPWEMIFSKK
ncbi:MAG: polyprenol monophosphomannose synthase [Minisyncoccia bacterium]